MELGDNILLIVTAQQLAVPTAGRDQFDALRAQMLRDIQPVNSIHVEFFNSALRAAWSIRRCDAAERELTQECGYDPLLSKDQRVDRLHRFRRQSERDYRVALAELKKTQTDRAMRQLAENKGLDALPVPIDTRTYIAAARQAKGFTSKQPISFPPVQATIDQTVRDLNLGSNAWEAWMNRQSSANRSSTPPPQSPPATDCASAAKGKLRKA